MPSFNLQAALAGNPVRLRNGMKAYIRYVLPEGHESKYPLQGYYYNGTIPYTTSWTLDGRNHVDVPEDHLDIVGDYIERKHHL